MPNAVPMLIKIIPLCGYFLKINTSKPLFVPLFIYSDLTVQVTLLNIFLILNFIHVFTLVKSVLLHSYGYWVVAFCTWYVAPVVLR